MGRGGDNTQAHQKLVDDLLYEFGSRDYIRMWPRVVGKAQALYSDAVIKYGINGECDLDAVVAPWGLKLAIEVKTGKGELEDDQIIYQGVMEKFGAIHIVARSVEQAVEEFETKLNAWKEKFLK